MRKIYCDIDALLDTRYPIVKSFFKDNNEYLDRKMDCSTILNIKTFRTLYSLRNSNVLLNSFITLIVEEINGLYLFKHKEDIINKDIAPIYLDINIYYYTLSNKAKTLLLKKFKLLFPQLVVNLIDIEINEKILSSYYAIIMYDGLPYLDRMMCNGYLKSNIKPDTIMVCPLQIPKITKDTKLFIGDIIKKYEPYINIQFIPFLLMSGHNITK